MSRYHLGGTVFTSLAVVRERCQAILRSCIGDLSGDDAAFVADLLARHPRGAEKRGVGVAAYVVLDRNIVSESRCFGVRQLDGSVVDFSYRRCLYRSTPLVELDRALRREIRPQCTVFMEKQLRAWNLPMQASTWHVHHATEFSAIRDTWMKARRYSVGDIAVIHTEDETDLMLADREQAEEWQRYHALHARLQLLRVHDHQDEHRREATMGTDEGILERLQASGMTVRIDPTDPGRLLVRPPNKVTAVLAEMIRKHKPYLLRELAYRQEGMQEDIP